MSYAGDTTRCPWCHAHWTLILSSGWHSCEMWQFWMGLNPKWRIATARQMRQAAQNGQADEAAALGRYPQPTDPAPSRVSRQRGGSQLSGSGDGQRQPPSR